MAPGGKIGNTARFLAGGVAGSSRPDGLEQLDHLVRKELAVSRHQNLRGHRYRRCPTFEFRRNPRQGGSKLGTIKPRQGPISNAGAPVVVNHVDESPDLRKTRKSREVSDDDNCVSTPKDGRREPFEGSIRDQIRTGPLEID